MNQGTIIFIVLSCVASLAAVAIFAMREAFRIVLSGRLRLETAVVSAKALCFVIIGFFTPLTVGLAQWANSGQWPGPLIWIIMGASCMVGAGSQLLSFLSGSYSDYVAGKKQPTSGFDTSVLTKPKLQAQGQVNQPEIPAQPIHTP